LHELGIEVLRIEAGGAGDFSALRLRVNKFSPAERIRNDDARAWTGDPRPGERRISWSRVPAERGRGSRDGSLAHCEGHRT